MMWWIIFSLPCVLLIMELVFLCCSTGGASITCSGHGHLSCSFPTFIGGYPWGSDLDVVCVVSRVTACSIYVTLGAGTVGASSCVVWRSLDSDVLGRVHVLLMSWTVGGWTACQIPWNFNTGAIGGKILSSAVDHANSCIVTFDILTKVSSICLNFRLWATWFSLLRFFRTNACMNWSLRTDDFSCSDVTGMMMWSGLISKHGF